MCSYHKHTKIMIKPVRGNLERFPLTQMFMASLLVIEVPLVYTYLSPNHGIKKKSSSLGNLKLY